MFSCKDIEIWQYRCYQSKGSYDGKKSKQHGLTNKLDDKPMTYGPDGFADAHFFCTFHRTCSCQVHKINTGYQQNKNGHHTEQPYVFDTAAVRLALFENRLQVH